jgi:1-acyl-sn-glycerol-3-phosphate acyltransferase
MWLRSVILWLASIAHFLIVGIPLSLLSFVLSSRQMDPLVMWFFRNVLRVAGARFRIRHAAGFDPERTALFIANHVNIFDPMIVFSAVPQHLRGMELESHFRVPVYGWLARNCGNIGLPKAKGRTQVQEVARRIKAALDAGVSVIVFAEGHRTRDGHVAAFQRGIFAMAQDWGVPIVPMSITGAYTFKNRHGLMLRPSTITVWLHDVIETSQLGRQEVDALRGRVHETVSRPVEEAIRGAGWSPELAAYRQARSAAEVAAASQEASRATVPSS